MFLGLRTAVYVVDDLERAAAWYADILGAPPTFAEPYYVGFDIGGFELGLTPAGGGAAPGPTGTVAFWGVADIEVVVARLLRAGATKREGVNDLHGGIFVASVLDPFGNVLGLVERDRTRPLSLR